MLPESAGRSVRRWEELDGLEEYERLCGTRLEHVVPVREPLVLVAQIHRSGGTLLSQLFDGHPECHAHPQELSIGGTPGMHEWPLLDLRAPERWFELLYETIAGEHFVRGYKIKRKANKEIFPFVFLPRLQKRIFDGCIEAKTIETERDVLDCYFTSYFNAWVDNENLHSGPKRIVTAFMPRLNLDLQGVDRFFAAYPDGFLVSLVRDPRAWYASARGHKYERGSLAGALEHWRASTAATIREYERLGERVLVLTYEQLVRDTEVTMRRLAERIGIEMSPVLLSPTFNKRPIRANSSDRQKRHGVLPERASAYRDTLDASTIAQVEGLAGDLYERAAALSAWAAS